MKSAETNLPSPLDALREQLPANHPGKTADPSQPIGASIWPLAVKNSLSGLYLTIRDYTHTPGVLWADSDIQDIWNFYFDPSNPDNVQMQHAATGKWVKFYYFGTLIADADSIDDAASFTIAVNDGGWTLFSRGNYYTAIDSTNPWMVSGLPAQLSGSVWFSEWTGQNVKGEARR